MKNKINKKDIISFLGVFFLILGEYINYSAIEEIIVKRAGFITSGAIGFVLLVAGIIDGIRKKEYTKKQTPFIIGGFVASLLLCLCEASFFLAFVIAFHFLNKDLKKLIKYMFISSLICFVGTIILSFIGVLPSLVMSRGEDINRFCLGFVHPNILYRCFIGLILMGLFCFKDSKLYMLTCALLGLLLYFITNSRGGIIAITLMTILVLLPDKLKKECLKTKAIPYLFIICFSACLLEAAFYDHIETINAFLSGRPAIYNIYLKEVGFFGKFGQLNGMPLDNVYIGLLYRGGIFGVLLFTVMFFIAFKNKITNHNLVTVFVVSLVYGIVENCIGLGENLFVVLLFLQVMNLNKFKEINEDNIKEKEALVCE